MRSPWVTGFVVACLACIHCGSDADDVTSPVADSGTDGGDGAGEADGSSRGDGAVETDGSSTSDAGGDVDASDAAPPPVITAGHCVQTPLSCGSESCCTSIVVAGGTLPRVSLPALVSSFRLDKYEVTVGRFRGFAAAWDGGYRPSAGAGKHAHLSQGLANVAASGGAHETGWDTAWATQVSTSSIARRTAGSVDPRTSWSDAVGANEDKPINFVNWYEGYAFCIWDGGFLPSELEWQYAAAGGGEEAIRPYPWGETEPANDAVSAVYGCYYGAANGLCSTTDSSSLAPVGSAPAGNARWGHADLAGNLLEWTMDEYGSYTKNCVDCAWLPGTSTNRVVRGGSYAQSKTFLATSHRAAMTPTTRFDFLGFRCARTP
jgi:formylglycine-generating enzyme required for sulfatase activity